MFRQLAVLANSQQQVFLYHSAELAHYLELVWARRVRANLRPSPARPQPPLAATTLPAVGPNTVWNHIIYAYAIEATRIVSIFDRVVYEGLNGERLGVLSAESQLWLRNTEDLFHKDPPSFAVHGVRSDVRPDYAAVRRNAYYRMFGTDLPQFSGGDAGFVKPEASNQGFKRTFEEFLREAWVGVQNVNNTSGANPTDNLAVANLARRLQEMLTDRRLNGSLSREEFFAVAAMSWLHLTVEFNSPIVQDLRANGASPEQRLCKIGEKVGLAPDTNADSYFQMAQPLSNLLDMIERQQLNHQAAVPALLYTQGVGLRADIETAVTHWSITTGTNLKATKVAVSGGSS